MPTNEPTSPDTPSGDETSPFEDADIVNGYVVQWKPGCDPAETEAPPPKDTLEPEIKLESFEAPPAREAGSGKWARWCVKFLGQFISAWSQYSATFDLGDGCYDDPSPTQDPPAILKEYAPVLLTETAWAVERFGQRWQFWSRRQPREIAYFLRETRDDIIRGDYEKVCLETLQEHRLALESAIAPTEPKPATEGESEEGAGAEASQITRPSIEPWHHAVAILLNDPAIPADDLAAKVGVTRQTLYSQAERWKGVREILLARKKPPSGVRTDRRQGRRGGRVADAPPKA